ncbi:hypothetical protein [Streptomyces purpureus]|uniref:Uncharacterized protein n=1 Tax=Streptomyces purpureus TaxID=1951 RepID=A0A918HFK8_9ACTN|nr:hypothetical protein [Streptomyces purpureus]GGT61195.1 hypothetical protein GCM10014713_63290 [Streptomyces purpureus]
MPASERERETRTRTSPRPESAVSMTDLLASCAAASAVSTPPRKTEPDDVTEEHEPRRDAA